jgi:zinc and cadmium transporter
MTTLIIFAAAFSVMLVSLAGVVFTNRTLGRWMRKRLTYLATFSAGVLAVLAYHLIEEALHEAESLALVAGSVIVGAIVLEIIHHALPSGTHHHYEVPEDHAHTAVDGRRILISDAVHNTTDGFIIVPAFLLDWSVGIAATAGVLLHELVQEISEFFVLKEAGYSTKRALTLNFAVSGTILVGAALALVLASFEGVLAVLAGLAAGGFLSVVLRDLLPHAFASIKAHGRGVVHAVAAVLGVAVMFGVIGLVPHAEAEGDHGNEEELLEIHDDDEDEDH